MNLTNRITPHLNGEPELEVAPAADPHARALVPVWSAVKVVAEAGTKFRVRERDGALVIFVRAPMMAGYPQGTPSVETGEPEVEIVPPLNTFQILSPHVQYADHEFAPSRIDARHCTVCARPSRTRWRLEIYRRGKQPGTMEGELRWFDEQDGALAERAVLAGDAEIIGLGLSQATWREPAEA
jgi:hypothetical protein